MFPLRYFLANPRHKFTLGQKPEISYSAMDNGEISTWHKEMDAIMDAYFSRRGVEVGHTHILIHACPLIGTKSVSVIMFTFDDGHSSTLLISPVLF